MWHNVVYQKILKSDDKFFKCTAGNVLFESKNQCIYNQISQIGVNVHMDCPCDMDMECPYRVLKLRVKS